MNKVTQLFNNFKEKNYIGEAISQEAHALQCAYFAKRLGHSDEVILASLLHDIGHVALTSPQPQMDGLGVINHEWIGAKCVIEAGLPKRVGRLIGLHVAAKRYLAAKKPQYQKRLSSASQGTLTFQGGPMSLNECQRFEALSYFKEALQVRAHDEKGKLENLEYPDLKSYLPLIERYLNKNIPTTTRVFFYKSNDELPSNLDDTELALSYNCSAFDEHIIQDLNLGLKAVNENTLCAINEFITAMRTSVIHQYHLVATTTVEQAIKNLAADLCQQTHIASTL